MTTIRLLAICAAAIAVSFTSAALACDTTPQELGMTSEEYQNIVSLSEREGSDGCAVMRGYKRFTAVLKEALAPGPIMRAPPGAQPRACDKTAADLGITSQQYENILVIAERDGLDGCHTMRILGLVRPAGISPKHAAPDGAHEPGGLPTLDEYTKALAQRLSKPALSSDGKATTMTYEESLLKCPASPLDWSQDCVNATCERLFKTDPNAARYPACMQHLADRKRDARDRAGYRPPGSTSLCPPPDYVMTNQGCQPAKRR